MARPFSAPSGREPVTNVPRVVLVLLLLLAAIHLARGAVSLATDLDLIGRFAFVPLRLTALFDPGRVADQLASWAASSVAEAQQRHDLGRFFLASPTPVLATLLTYSLLHGGWVHLGLNSVWLLAFGSPVARRLGAARFLGLFVAAAVAGALAHWACFPFGAEPVVGASAAVSGFMGAAVRFAFQAPRQNGLVGQDGRALPIPRPLTVLEVVRDRRALSFVVVWFLGNALFGEGSVAFGLSDSPVAWQAHVGGFVAGFFLLRSLDPYRAARGDDAEELSLEPEALPADKEPQGPHV